MTLVSTLGISKIVSTKCQEQLLCSQNVKLPLLRVGHWLNWPCFRARCSPALPQWGLQAVTQWHRHPLVGMRK